MFNLKHRKLTEEQKKNLETLRELEREQAAILQQLAFLTSLAGGPKPTVKTSENSLANRVSIEFLSLCVSFSVRNTQSYNPSCSK